MRKANKRRNERVRGPVKNSSFVGYRACTAPVIVQNVIGYPIIKFLHVNMSTYYSKKFEKSHNAMIFFQSACTPSFFTLLFSPRLASTPPPRWRCDGDNSRSYVATPRLPLILECIDRSSFERKKDSLPMPRKAREFSGRPVRPTYLR